MVIQVRGTSGSGKSTLARAVLQRLGSQPFHVEGRKRPLFYALGPPAAAAAENLVVGYLLGHYETPCGGCDTIKTPEQAFALAQQLAANGKPVLMEGLLLSADVKRTLRLWKAGEEVLVVRLTTPIERSLANVELRRAARGDTRPLDPANTEARHKATYNAVTRLMREGVNVRELEYGRALYDILAEFGVS